MKEKKRILVTGASRSGTKSMSRMLKQLGLDTPHEKMGEDGCVSCYMFQDVSHYPYSPYDIHEDDELFDDYKFDLIVHLVRNPLSCIPSNTAIMNKSHQEWLAGLGMLDIDEKPKIIRMMQMWLNLNKRIEHVADMRMKIEDAGKEVRKIASALKIEVPKSFTVKHMHKGSGFLKREKATWGELLSVDKLLARQVKELAKKYGYKN